jgi:hypothetical protein
MQEVSPQKSSFPHRPCLFHGASAHALLLT